MHCNQFTSKLDESGVVLILETPIESHDAIVQLSCANLMDNILVNEML